ncbi:MAG: hypothetical protein K6F61_01390 [Clostridiales bacterium]|nr:hypothetical protein [Clostridiales bacterium]
MDNYRNFSVASHMRAYDNDIYCLHSFRPMHSRVRVVVRGECEGLQGLETGRIYKNSKLLPAPCKRQDGALTHTASAEYALRRLAGACI